MSPTCRSSELGRTYRISDERTARRTKKGDGRDGRPREHTRLSPETREEERREAKDAADAGPRADSRREEAADRNEPDEEVAEHYDEMTERVAKQRREGRVP